jgi:heterodisulfide reductase subunit A2
LAPKLVEVGRHPNIELLTLCEVLSVSGEEGDFQVRVIQHPRYVDISKCIACGQCAAKCPKKVFDTYNQGLAQRKAIYVPYSQAVPLKYSIDPQNCIYLTKGKCRACEKACPTGAIDFNDQQKETTLAVGSVILAPGFQPYDPASDDIYAYGTSPNVVTALEFERMLSATGPYAGHLLRPSAASEHTPPRKIAWIQCVGSRDINRCENGYCSSVCCMIAVKQSVMAKNHSSTPLDCAIFYMDMRTQGKDFDRYYENAGRVGIRFIRSRIHSISKVNGDGDLLIRYVQENGSIIEEIFDLAVLSTGLQIDPEVAQLAKRLGIELDPYRFVQTDTFHPVATSRPGIYACGAFTGPKDIPQSVIEASAAACAATEKLAAARGTRTSVAATPPEKDVRREAPKIGVFVCNCGINIGGVVDVPAVAQYAKTLPNVAYVEENLFTCSQDTQDKITAVIREKGLNRIVIAACTPRTHEALFQETLINANLNKYLLEMANIRNQDSWVHANNPAAATQKAKTLVRMAVAKSSLLSPLQQTELPINHTALVVGGGIAGMTAALALARQGYPVHIVEQSDRLGGNARHLHRTYRGENISTFMSRLIEEIRSEDLIRIHLATRIADVDGFIGNFKTELLQHSLSETVEHGVAILATGAKEHQTAQYLYGQHSAVVTQLELDQLFKQDDPRLSRASNVVFIQCVGSREPGRPYCSKVCCTHTVKSALEFKDKNPDANVYVLYRDMRTYGKREDIYREARARGVMFFRYDPDLKPKVKADGILVEVIFKDPILNRYLSVHADFVCLATGVESNHDLELARKFKVPLDSDGWLLEAHQKLRPVDFANDGVFVCGMAHYPKPIEESIAQAQAAASRALTVLALDSIKVGGVVSYIQSELCSGCLGCIAVCPFGAIAFNSDRRIAEVNPALCKGCGACAAACPSEAPVLMGFNNEQLYAQIKNALAA